MKTRLEHIRSLNLRDISDDDLWGYLSYLRKEIAKGQSIDDTKIKDLQVEFCYINREVETRRKK